MSKKVTQNSNQDNNTFDEVLFKSTGVESHLTQDEFSNINSNVQISPKNLDKLAVLQNATGNYTIQDNEFVEFKDLNEQSGFSLDESQNVSSVIEAHQYSVDMNLEDTKLDSDDLNINQAETYSKDAGEVDFIDVDDSSTNAELEATQDNNGFISQEQVSEEQASDTSYYEAGFNDVKAYATEDLINETDSVSDAEASADSSSSTSSNVVSGTVAKVNELGEKVNPHGEVVGNNKNDTGNGNGKGKKQSDIVDDETVAVTTDTTTDTTTTEVVDNTVDAVTDTTTSILDSGDNDSGSILI